MWRVWRLEAPSFTSLCLVTMVAGQSVASYTQGFLAPLAQYLPFGVDAAQIEEQESQAKAVMQSRAEAAQELASQQAPTQRGFGGRKEVLNVSVAEGRRRASGIGHRAGKGGGMGE